MRTKRQFAAAAQTSALVISGVKSDLYRNRTSGRHLAKLQSQNGMIFRASPAISRTISAAG